MTRLQTITPFGATDTSMRSLPHTINPVDTEPVEQQGNLG